MNRRYLNMALSLLDNIRSARSDGDIVAGLYEEIALADYNMQRERNEGFEAGRAAGYAVGREDGFRDGFDTGFDYGYDEADDSTFESVHALDPDTINLPHGEDAA